MNDQDIRAVVRDALAGIAPESANQVLDGKRRLRDQLDIDSVDFLNFLLALHERLGVDIAEADYAQLLTLDDAVAYLERKLRAGKP